MAIDPTGGLTGWDLSGFHEGHDTECWKRLGALEIALSDPDRGDVLGTRFSVWAPNARAVRVVGDFNSWDGRDHHLQLVPGSGVWALFVEGVSTGALYKFEILGADDVWRLKTDPMARFTEAAPHNASIVYNSQYAWTDDQWLWYRGERHAWQRPMSVYEVHLGSWRRGLTYVELARELVEYVSWQGFTHVEFLPLAEHPYEGSWGYHVTGYFAPVSRFGSPDELRYLIDQLHAAGIGVIMDWVPGHFATDPWALQRFDGTALYEHEDPRLGWHPDWGSYIFNLGRNEVKSFLMSNAYYWLDEFHIDGLRVDGVASMLYLDYSRGPGEWIPNRYGGNENLDSVAFLQAVNADVYRRKPGIITVAEESTSWPGVTRAVDHGGLGFGFKWNMGWMNDSLRYYGREPIHRQYHHGEITFASVYAYSENFVLPISHDEVVHGKGSMFERAPEDEWRKFATMRAFYAFMWSHPGKKLLFMGTEWGQRREFSEQRSLDWDETQQWGHRGVQSLIKDLNRVYRAHPALWRHDHDPSGFRWIDADDRGGNTFSFLRIDPGDETNPEQLVAAVINFSAEPRHDLRIGLPAEGRWVEILNTDAPAYDGTGEFGNLGEVISHPVPSHGMDYSATVVVPPLGAVWFRFDADHPVQDPEPVLAGIAESVREGQAPEPTAAVPVSDDAEDEVGPAAPLPKRARKETPSGEAAKPPRKTAASSAKQAAAGAAKKAAKKVAKKTTKKTGRKTTGGTEGTDPAQ